MVEKRIKILSHPLVKGRTRFLKHAEFIRSAAGGLVPGEGRVNVVLIGEKRMSYFNRKYKYRKGGAEILTFPYQGFPDGREGKPPLVGEIFLCWSPIARSASRRGVKIRSYILRLVIHGLLHLKGYSHSNEAEEERMEEEEKRYLRPFIEKEELDRLFD